jgi:hypothetical protein
VNARRRFLSTAALALVASLLATTVGLTPAGAAQPPDSDRGIVPQSFPGNFVSTNDNQQVCFDLELAGHIDQATVDMIGVKVDPPASFSDGYVSLTRSGNGRELAWEIEGARMLAVVVKGGPGYNVYDYAGTAHRDDGKLVSPFHKGKTPAIGHYNVCYVPNDVVEEPGTQGCTPGYWRNHADRWLGASPTDDFDTTFGVDLYATDITLGTAVSRLGGDGVDALARQATAALLNSLGGVPNLDATTVSYPYTTGQVTAMVQAAAAGLSDVDATTALLTTANALGCPLLGTPPVPA